MLVMEDNDAKKVMIAWKKYRPLFNDRPIKKGARVDIDQLWQEAWDSLGEIDFLKLSRNAGVPFKTTVDAWHRLVDCRLIYPDGTISPNASRLLNAEVGHYLRPYIPRNMPIVPPQPKPKEQPKK